MEATGIICEYNPLHLGHKKQLDTVRAAHPHGGIVCLMSGNYVQRGAPAIIDKSIRAKAAMENGADLVLELPVTASISSAEGFAQEGVRILSGFCKRLCFGAETADKDILLATAGALLRADFPEALHRELDKGLSFPAARQAALGAMGLGADTLSKPNDILATEYCKAILALGSAMEPMVIAREGGYHDVEADKENPSTTAVRERMYEDFVAAGNSPQDFYAHFQQNYKTQTNESVAGALMAGKRVEAFIPGKDGRVSDEPMQITKTGYEPSPVNAVTLNAWERFWSKRGFYKEKAKAAVEYQRTMEARERVKSTNLIDGYFEMDEGSVLYLENKIKRLLEEKTI